MSDHQGILNKCHALAIAVAPELEAQPLYVIDASELAGLPREPCAFGWTELAMFFNQNIRDRLGDSYRGPGRIIVLDVDAIRADAYPAPTRDQLRALCLGVTLHETAHLLPFSRVTEPPDRPHIRVLQRLAMQRSLDARAECGAPDEHHGLPFIRRALHLWVRAAALGWAGVPLARLLGVFGNSELHYLPHVAAEALAMREMTFAEIERTPPPAALVEAYAEDVDVIRRGFVTRGTDS